VVTATQALSIPLPLAEALLDHSRRELPNEACGLLSGSLAEGQALTFHPTRNAEDSPVIYNIHPDDLLAAMRAMEDAGQDLVAIFHSHTHSPAVPSATDRRQAMYPDAYYVLATLADPEAAPQRALRAWRIYGGQAFEVGLRLSERVSVG
jgi:[CysO sulfur-carrier protein]-S-L-cysteine hydrolase